MLDLRKLKTVRLHHAGHGVRCVRRYKVAMGGLGAGDCPYINAYCHEKHHGVVTCLWTEKKGRIIVSERAFKKGEVIFREPPLHIVAEEEGNEAFDRLKELCEEHTTIFDYDPLWYWTALSSLKPSQLPPGEARLKPITEDQQRQLLLLYHSEVTEASEASSLLVSEFGLTSSLDPLDLERLLQVWILNCFEHSDDPLGYSAYFMSSFMSHACFPTAVWHNEDDDFVLRARNDIKAEDEITVSYLSEDSLLKSAPARRKHLQASKHFYCECTRCSAQLDKARGFRCPKCTGTVFPCPQEADEAIAGAACELCHHELTASEAEMLVNEEKSIGQKIEGWERQLEEEGRQRHKGFVVTLKEVVARAEKYLQQHWLLDKSWQMLADLYERNNLSKDAEKAIQKRLVFQERAYPGLSGTYAWTLEAFADVLLKHSGVDFEPHVQVPNMDAARKLSSIHPTMTPRNVYLQSLGILCLMFGEQHEYCRSVRRKADELAKELRRFPQAASLT